MSVPWAVFFGVPSASMVLVWAAFFTRYRRELKRIPAWPALLFTTASAFAGVWGLIRLDELAKRSPFDYGYEGRAWMLAVIGFVSASIWVMRSRQWCSWATLVTSGWMAVIWMMICATL